MRITNCLSINVCFFNECVYVRDIREIESFCRENKIQFDYYRSTIQIFESDINKENIDYDDTKVSEMSIYLKEENFSMVENQIKAFIDRIIDKSKKNKFNDVPF